MQCETRSTFRSQLMVFVLVRVGHREGADELWALIDVIILSKVTKVTIDVARWNLAISVALEHLLAATVSPLRHLPSFMAAAARMRLLLTATSSSASHRQSLPQKDNTKLQIHQ